MHVKLCAQSARTEKRVWRVNTESLWPRGGMRGLWRGGVGFAGPAMTHWTSPVGPHIWHLGLVDEAAPWQPAVVELSTKKKKKGKRTYSKEPTRKQ